MPIKGKNIYEFGVELYNQFQSEKYIGDSRQETYLRTVINRLYYGVFLVARNKAGLDGLKSQIHQTVIDKYSGKAVSNRLVQLRELRQNSDYELDRSITTRDVGKALKISRGILKDLSVI